LNPTFIWHCRLGHINEKRIEQLHKDGLLSSFAFESFETCESCLLGKMTKAPFTGHSERVSDLLALVHTDVCGPMSSIARGGFQYSITFTDDFSRYGYIYLMRHKSESFEKFKEFQNEVQNQLGKTIKYLRSDREGEYLSLEFGDHLKKMWNSSATNSARNASMEWGIRTEEPNLVGHGSVDDEPSRSSIVILGLCS
jgi:hypothetical protein